MVERKMGDARAIKESLQEAGLNNALVVFKTAEDVRRHLTERDQNSIIILNIHSLDGEGLEFLDWVRGQPFHRDVLVIAVGERSQLRTVVEACDRGAHTFLIKPIHPEDLKMLAGRYPDHWARPRE